MHLNSSTHTSYLWHSGNKGTIINDVLQQIMLENLQPISNQMKPDRVA